MKEMLKDKRIVSVGAVVIVLIVLALGYFLFFNKSASQTGTGIDALPTQVPIPTITAEELGFTLKAGAAGKTVIAAIANTEGTASIDYELSYISKGDIPRGAIGSFDLTKKPVKKEITLGTCSDVCHYDQDVKNIKIVLKITKDDGKVYESEKTLESPDQ